jgi:tRNA(Ile)-lysidine synthase
MLKILYSSRESFLEKRGVDIVQSVHHFIKKHQLLTKNATVVVGVSGGPDSMALLQFLLKQSHHLNLTIIAAHVDHMLRSEDSEQDYEFVKNFCREKNIIFEGKQVDVNSYIKQKQLSVQMAARELRYQFFADIMKKYSAQYLALAHHGDDQVETMIMNATRGASGYGLAGIPYKREFSSGSIIRPFLSITKEEIEHYCKEEKIVPRRDASNESDKYVRNRFRKHVLPFLKQENPNVHNRYQMQSEMMIEDELFLQQLTNEKLEDCLEKKSEQKMILSVVKFNGLPYPLQRRMIHLILSYLYGQISQEVTSVHIQDTIALLRSNLASNKYLVLPKGLYIKRSYNKCTFSFALDEAESFSHVLNVPGELSLEIGKLTAKVIDHLPNIKHHDKNQLICDFNSLQFPLHVRSRQPGDRIVLKGLQGSKKIKDIFIDEKIDHSLRSIWPIVEDAKGSVIWLPGLKLSNVAHFSKDTKKYVVLQFNNVYDNLGGS